MTDKASSVPSYLNEEFFKTAVEKELNTNICIHELEVKCDQMGGNYCSDIYRVSLKYTDSKNVNKTAKASELHLLVKELFEQMSDNSREHFMYETVLPAMHVILRKGQIHKALTPRLYFGLKTHKEIHVFEDMNTHGYKICDRLVGFDEQETRRVLHKLAQFHAASMIYKKKEPAIVANMKEFYCKSDPGFLPFVETMINDNTAFVTKVIDEKWPELSKITQKMRYNTGKTFTKKFLSILNKEDAKVRVIAHGDLWIKNILVLSEEDIVQDAIFLDFQNCFDGSPAFDINNLLMTSVQADVLKTKRVQLIQHYHNSLLETLQACNDIEVNAPSFADIMDELNRTEYYTYYHLIFSFPQTNLSEKLAKDMDFSGFMDPERMERNRQDMFSNKRVLDTFYFTLQRLDDLGTLD